MGRFGGPDRPGPDREATPLRGPDRTLPTHLLPKRATGVAALRTKESAYPPILAPHPPEAAAAAVVAAPRAIRPVPGYGFNPRPWNIISGHYETVNAYNRPHKIGARTAALDALPQAPETALQWVEPRRPFRSYGSRTSSDNPMLPAANMGTLLRLDGSLGRRVAPVAAAAASAAATPHL
eukprot:TRINITY_DN47372_c0_g1_i1.p1 TRINITY_DN47372_c0_g1~~TRINITY_DN47372_c0_g1_i1.p1  ORF type:complete len:192 (+),score=15.71 TRINITY_DN47372_c0_g1_i1:39-578(+)